jgi:hypothetical protein
MNSFIFGGQMTVETIPASNSIVHKKHDFASLAIFNIQYLIKRMTRQYRVDTHASLYWNKARQSWPPRSRLNTDGVIKGYVQQLLQFDLWKWKQTILCVAALYVQCICMYIQDLKPELCFSLFCVRVGFQPLFTQNNVIFVKPGFESRLFH